PLERILQPIPLLAAYERSAASVPDDQHAEMQWELSRARPQRTKMHRAAAHRLATSCAHAWYLAACFARVDARLMCATRISALAVNVMTDPKERMSRVLRGALCRQPSLGACTLWTALARECDLHCDGAAPSHCTSCPCRFRHHPIVLRAAHVTSRGVNAMYIDGFVIPVPKASKEQFIEHARRADSVFMDLGATRILEYWGCSIPEGQV